MILSKLIQWPLPEILNAISWVYVCYLARNLIIKHYYKFQAKLLDLIAINKDQDDELKQIKQLMFRDVNYLLKKLNQTDRPYFLEIGIGVGNNWLFYPKNSIIAGLDCNPFCESIALNRLCKSILITNQNLEFKDYLIGFAENMSYIRSNSIQIVVITDFLSQVENPNEVLGEIFRILKPNGILVCLDRNRQSLIDSLMNQKNVNKNNYSWHKNNSEHIMFLMTNLESSFKILVQNNFEHILLRDALK